MQDEIARTDDNPERFRDFGVEVIEGEAAVTGPREVTVGDRVLRTRYTLVCTGSRPFIPPIDGIADVDILDQREPVRDRATARVAGRRRWRTDGVRDVQALRRLGSR